jgi:hypothetical protein
MSAQFGGALGRGSGVSLAPRVGVATLNFGNDVDRRDRRPAAPDAKDVWLSLMESPVERGWCCTGWSPSRFDDLGKGSGDDDFLAGEQAVGADEQVAMEEVYLDGGIVGEECRLNG